MTDTQTGRHTEHLDRQTDRHRAFRQTDRQTDADILPFSLRLGGAGTHFEMASAPLGNTAIEVTVANATSATGATFNSMAI